MKKVIVTGSSRGIGRAIAICLAKAGYDPVLHCVRRPEAAKAVAEEVKSLGGTGEILKFDISDREEAKAALATPEVWKASPGFIDRMLAGEYSAKGYRTLSCEKSFRKLDFAEVMKET